MEERVFADEFRKGFLQEEDFLTFLERREENSEWGTVKSNEIRFYPIEEGHQISAMLEEKLRETGKANVFEDTLEHTRLILKVKEDLYPVLADVKAQSSYQRRAKIENIIAMREIYQDTLIKEHCVTLRDLAVTGKDLMEIGMKPGRELGNMLNELLEWVIDDPQCNKKELLCEYVKERLGL